MEGGKFRDGDFRRWVTGRAGSGHPDSCCICRQVYQQRDWWILNGGWNNLTFFWALAILFVKGRKVNFQRKILALNLIPQDPNFFLNNATARDALLRIRGQVDDPKHFLLLNRIDVALSNLQNIGEISEVASLTNAQASIDEDQVSASYSLINGFNWAIPVLGFIGTVLGLWLCNR